MEGRRGGNGWLEEGKKQCGGGRGEGAHFLQESPYSSPLYSSYSAPTQHDSPLSL